VFAETETNIMGKRSVIIIFTLLFQFVFVFSQNNSSSDSLKTLLKKSNDSVKVDIYTKLCWNLRNSEPKNAIRYGKFAIKLANQINYKQGIVKAYGFTGVAYRNTGNYAVAFDYYLKGLELAKKYNILEQQGYAYINLGNLYLYQKKTVEAISNLNNALDIANSISNKGMISYCYLNLGRAELHNNKLDSAKTHFIKSLEIRKAMKDEGKIAVSNKYLADVYGQENNFDKALAHYKKALNGIKKSNDLDLLADLYHKVANLYLKEKRYELSVNNALMSLKISKQIGAKLRVRNAHQSLANIYLIRQDYKKASHHLDEIIKLNENLFNKQLSEKILNIKYSLEQEQKQNQINMLNAQKDSQREFIVVLAIALLLAPKPICHQFVLYPFSSP